MVLDNCKKCKTPIQEFITGRKKISGDLYCKKCYYEKLGDFVEENPIGSPMTIAPRKLHPSM